MGVKRGTIITGKWQKKSYTIIRMLGSGMIGTVYVCRHNGNLYALKMGKHPTALVREVNMLKRLNKVRDQRLGPFLVDVDDWQMTNSASYPFYVMEYIQGTSIDAYIKKHGAHSISVLLVDLLHQLNKLHHMGYVYGDLKNENIVIIPGSPPTVRLIDVGGMTKMGQSVREYSGFYDRGYWQLGSRKADASYDLFALVMIMITVYYPKQFRRGRNPRQQLFKAIQHVPALQRYIPSLKKALYGSYASAKAMQKDIERLKHQQRIPDQQTEEPLVTQAIIITFCSIGFILADYLL